MPTNIKPPGSDWSSRWKLPIPKVPAPPRVWRQNLPMVAGGSAPAAPRTTTYDSGVSRLPGIANPNFIGPLSLAERETVKQYNRSPFSIVNNMLDDAESAYNSVAAARAKMQKAAGAGAGTPAVAYAPPAPTGNAAYGDPDAFPGVGDNALDNDAAWGEKFYRTYGRAPSDYDWNNRWHAARGTAGYGDNRGGGGGAAAPAIGSSLPNEYKAGFSMTFGKEPSAWYTDANAAQTDYETMKGTWENATGMPISGSEWSRAWSLINARRAGQPFYTFNEALGALQSFLKGPLTPPGVTYLNTSEV